MIARTIKEPQELRPVAQKLSESLGAPKEPIDAEKPNIAYAAALKSLNAGILRQQQQLEKLNETLAEYQGKKIEGTGFNLFGITSVTGIVLLVAGCIGCPSLATFLWFMLRKMRSAFTATIKGIQDFKSENPDAADKINSALNGAQDAAHKVLVKKLKLNLQP